MHMKSGIYQCDYLSYYAKVNKTAGCQKNSVTNYSEATRASKLELTLTKAFKTASFRSIDRF